MRTFSYPGEGSWRERGRAHGRAFAGEIRSLAELRVYLTRTVGGFETSEQVLELARQHLPVLERYDADLAAELVGIAEGAGVAPELIAVLNHYTDLRDLGSRGEREAEVIGADGCTALWARTPVGPVLAQTWDMHASAMPYVIMLEVPVDAGTPMWLLSLTGCLGMAGLAGSGVAVSINNLHSTDARVGLIWSALVRRALAAPSAAAARDEILAAPVGSGHHYLVGDAEVAYGVETSGALREIVFDSSTGGDLYVHTNHCLAGAVAASSRVPEGSTTYDRLEIAARDARERPIADAADAFARLGSEEGYPRSVCTNMASAERPHAAATCGALAVDLTRRRLLACAGFPHNATPEIFDL
jgi:isopenicillin-N N-acyltransferase-like protein